VNKRFLLSLIGVVLIALSGVAQAQCENMVVIVRNSIYQINGLDAFCQEFNKMKTDLASMKSALSNARQENAMLKSRLTNGSLPKKGADLVLLDFSERPVQSPNSAR